MSRIEKILQAMIDETSYDETPQSRIEAILLAIKNNTQYSDLPHSRIEEILLAIKNNTLYDKESMSRIEEILLAKLNGLEYTKLPQSRIEELLIEWLTTTTYKELTGVPPLTFVSNGENLVDYRIYGVSGGVGDRTRNLFDVANQIENYFLNPNGSIEYSSSHATNTSDYIDVTNINILTLTGIHHTPPISTNDRRSLFFNDAMGIVGGVGIRWNISSPFRINVPNNAKYFRFSYDATFENVMLYSGNNDIPYEPYGYKIPIVCGGTTTNIYLDDPLNEGESISMSDTGVSIPTINGTNILTVDTAVQPSNVYLKYKGG